MFSALTKVLQKTLTSVGTNTYLHNGHKLTARSTADAEISDNSDSGEGDEERMMDGIWSLSMKWIMVFTMRST